MSPPRAVRAASAVFILAVFGWFYAEGVFKPGSLGWMVLVPLFLLGYLAYAFLAHAGEAALEGRELGLRSDGPPAREQAL